MTSREPSLGELADDFVEMREELRSGIRDLKADLASRDGRFLRYDLYEAHRAADRAELAVVALKINALEAWKTWAARTFATGILAQVVAAVLLYAILGGGS